MTIAILAGNPESRLDHDRLLDASYTEAEGYRTKPVLSTITISGTGSRPETAQKDFCRACERRLNDIEERGRRNQLSLQDVDELNWLRSFLKKTPKVVAE